MIINHNISALNTYRNLTSVNNALQKSLERLSSGLRINRAADDAAGLAISEKMRGQIRGLAQAIRNAQDAISLIQTAEGALNETHSILQRMRELVVQASNETATPSDRQAIQDELNQLIQELNRIGNTTEFNTQKLLDGTFNGKQFQIGANVQQTVALSIDDMRSTALGANWGDGTSIKTSGITDGTLTINGIGITISSSDTVEGIVEKINAVANVTGVRAERVEKTEVNAGKFTAPDGTNATTATIKINGVAVTVTDSDTIDTLLDKINAVSTQTGVTASKDSSDNIILTSAAGAPIKVQDDGTTNVLGNIGTTEEEYVAGIRLWTKIGGSISVSQSTGLDLGFTGFSSKDHTVNNTSVGKIEDAATSLLAIDYAIRSVSQQRSQLGALQNRLEHTINNLNVAKENLTAAESRIRDLDMAEEMMTFTRNQIISQAATAMLAQANQVPAIVLQLLR